MRGSFWVGPLDKIDLVTAQDKCVMTISGKLNEYWQLLLYVPSVIMYELHPKILWKVCETTYENSY